MLTILTYAGLFVASVVITLGGCHLFTNGIEWLGKRLKVSEGAVGSVFAAVGTTLPETSIPIIAIFFGTGQERADVGLGAILGAPFMLSTLVLPILAMLLLLYARLGKRPPQFKLDYGEVRVDLLFFLVGYSLALSCVFVPSKVLHVGVAIGLILASAFSAILVYAQELVPGRVGLVAGLFFGFAFGIGGIGAATLGKLADVTSIDFVFRVCAVLPALGLLTVFLPDLRRDKVTLRA